jgi:hypothetical protein
MRVINAAIFVALFMLVSELSGELHAYLDPGSGSMLIQVILGVIVGGLALVRLYWQRLMALVWRRRKVENSSFAE